MKNPPQITLPRTLQEQSWGEGVDRIISAALNAVDPSHLIQQRTTRKGSKLILMGETVDLKQYATVHLLAIGKAALPMAVTMADVLGEYIDDGYILTKKGGHPLPDRYKTQMQLFMGGHPYPDEEGQQATAAILSKFTSLNNDDLVIVLISGGASALFTAPAEGISLGDLNKTNQVLLACGANIIEINTIRKHLSQIKGGQLARFLQPATIYGLILSDVIGDQIDTIGSGPTAPDPSTYKDALAIVDRYSLEGEMPPAVLSRLHQGRQGKHSETPKPEDPIFDSVSNFILASNHDALQAGAAQADQEGYSVNTLPGFLTGEACQAGKKLAEKLTKIALQDQQLLPRPVCLIAGGETSVTMTNTKKPGQGGRNLETALCALLELDGLDNIILITLATDGEDGLTTAAGAVVTEKSYNRCRQLGLNPTEYLARHDSFTLFKALDDLLITGPTGTNVNDLCFLFAF